MSNDARQPTSEPPTEPKRFIVPPGRELADVVQQRRPAQHRIRAVVLQRDRLAQHGQRMLVDVLVLIRPSCGAIFSIASRTRGATVKPSCDTNCAARSSPL